MNSQQRILLLLIALLAVVMIVRDYYQPQFQYSGEGPTR